MPKPITGGAQAPVPDQVAPANKGVPGRRARKDEAAAAAKATGAVPADAPTNGKRTKASRIVQGAAPAPESAPVRRSRAGVSSAGKVTASGPGPRPTPAPPADGASPRKRHRPMTVQEARAFIEALADATPDPVTELNYKDPYTLLVAVVLSAQATDASVNRVTSELYRIADTPAAMVALGVDEVARHVRSIGLWKTKAQNVVALSRRLLDEHGGQVPGEREKLEALPGVGRKTANVVLNVAFNEATMAVDTHVFRVSNRTGLAPGATPRAVEDGLMKRIPRERLANAHHWLILHGRYVCKARRPECWRCVGAPWCRYQPKTIGPDDPGGTSAAKL